MEVIPCKQAEVVGAEWSQGLTAGQSPRAAGLLSGIFRSSQQCWRFPQHLCHSITVSPAQHGTQHRVSAQKINGQVTAIPAAVPLSQALLSAFLLMLISLLESDTSSELPHPAPPPPPRKTSLSCEGTPPAPHLLVLLYRPAHGHVPPACRNGGFCLFNLSLAA